MHAKTPEIKICKKTILEFSEKRKQTLLGQLL